MLQTKVTTHYLRHGLMAVVVLILVACSGSAAEETTTAPPPPATEAEMEVFCARYQEVKGLNERWAELEKVAPTEIKGALFRLSNGPSENYWTDLAAVEEFEQRCEA